MLFSAAHRLTALPDFFNKIGGKQTFRLEPHTKPNHRFGRYWYQRIELLREGKAGKAKRRLRWCLSPDRVST